MSAAAHRPIPAWCVLGVAAAAFAVYAGTLGHGLVWDDVHLVDLVERYSRADGLRGVLAGEFVVGAEAQTPYYRPVVLASLWLDARFSTFHLTNVLLHTACSVLLLVLVSALGGRPLPATAGALLFAVHPVHTESVAFVSGRTDLWAALFTLGSALVWVRVRSGRLGTGWALASHFSLALAVLSKEVAVVAPIALAAWTGLLRPGATDRRGILRREWVWLAGWVAVGGLVLALRQMTVGGIGTAPPAIAGFAGRPGWVLAYGRLLVAPWPLNALYLPEQVVASVPNAIGTLGLVMLFCAVAVRVSGRAAALAAVWSVVFLLPVLGLVPVQAAPIAERFLYLPSMGLALLGAVRWPEGHRSRRGPGVFIAATIAVALAMAAGTVTRSAVWRDEVTFFRRLTETSPRSADAFYNLGSALAARGEERLAEEALRRAIALEPRHDAAHNNLGILRARGGDPTGGVQSFARAVEIDPRSTDYRENLAKALIDADRPGEAVVHLEALLRAGADTAELRCAMGEALASAGRLREALSEFEIAVRRDPGSLRARYGLARVAQATGDAARAEAAIEKLRDLDPELAERLDRQSGTSAP